MEETGEGRYHVGHNSGWSEVADLALLCAPQGEPVVKRGPEACGVVVGEVDADGSRYTTWVDITPFPFAVCWLGYLLFLCSALPVLRFRPARIRKSRGQNFRNPHP